jgi:hypothetical protein
VAVPTRLTIAALLAVRVAHADPDPWLDAPHPAALPSDADIVGGDPGWKIEDVQFRSTYLSQSGKGFQSEAGPMTGPGSERTTIFEPWALMTIRQNDHIVHEVTVPADFVTAASPDALDAMTSASRRNESVTVEVRTSITRSERDTLTTRISGHIEEPLSSGTAGVGWRRTFADDNAAVAVNGNLTIDGFDDRSQNGSYLGKAIRETTNANLSATQLLSPSTVLDGSYGITYQHGTLQNTWNAVPIVGLAPAAEHFPPNRVRHAVSARLAQHIPLTHSTLKVWYRYYADDFRLRAHSVEVSAYQYLVNWLYVRGGYRFHRQTGVDFFTTSLAERPPDNLSRTADSDLAPFDANEWSFEMVVIGERAPRWLRAWSVSAEVLRYVRTNDLTINVVSLAIGRRL